MLFLKKKKMRDWQGRDPTYGGPEAQGHGAGRQAMALAGRTNGRTAGVLCCVAALGMEWIDWAAGVCL